MLVSLNAPMFLPFFLIESRNGLSLRTDEEIFNAGSWHFYNVFLQISVKPDDEVAMVFLVLSSDVHVSRSGLNMTTIVHTVPTPQPLHLVQVSVEHMGVVDVHRNNYVVTP